VTSGEQSSTRQANHPPTPLSGSSNPLLGLACMALAVVSFPFLNASVKYLTVDYPIPQVIWFRYMGHLIFMLAVFMPSNGWRLFATNFLWQQLLRSLLLFGSTLCYFSGVSYLPLATGAAINFTGPFIITALSAKILGEKVGKFRWGAVIVGFAGALIIIRPGGTTFEWPMFFFVGSTLCYSFYQILTRMTVASDSSATTITYTAIVGAVISSIAIPFFWTDPMNIWHGVLFFSIGVMGGFGHFLVIKALQFAEASLLAPLNYGQLVGAVLFGYFVFSDFPDFWTWIGAAIVVASGLFIAYRERKLAGKR
jgi:drug/metabolite transporter (DMT)-like permease